MPRIQLSPLDTTHALFIIELVNSPGWLEFIGERNVKSREDADAYIRKIESNPAVDYWVIELVTSGEPVGIVTLIQRDYLQSPDIGFALLPAFEKQGYAFEAVSLFLNDFFSVSTNKEIHAIILDHNRPSIQLVQKLGLVFSDRIEVNGEQLSLYSKKIT
ncbi:GNAT family N-acetyltransferase [Imperialibacter roseus]|uniref:GNAT family N-acetyltransferase n=1 Tax=Imperialibacter roseus TaxID=1324217 RepID=A0ABZ0IRW7_9BACT|nr:GNAT family N-acetyltransferase [Imperialibacter roseus]WOK07115.1 GNAT family N-acetyltransferase [Imperialibacter roseus]|tara:strand:+ start:24596 stop:25075 length:480 start_codon:yes stop_codon:yes gene_type:complete